MHLLVGCSAGVLALVHFCFEEMAGSGTAFNLRISQDHLMRKDPAMRAR